MQALMLVNKQQTKMEEKNLPFLNLKQSDVDDPAALFTAQFLSEHAHLPSEIDIFRHRSV